MDEGSLENSIATYRQQLHQVTTLLQSAGEDGQDDLVQLKKDLEEVIQLTEESLLSLKKSRLMSLVEGGIDIQDEASQETKPTESSTTLSIDDEYEAFKMMLSEDLKDGETSSISQNPLQRDHREADSDVKDKEEIDSRINLESEEIDSRIDLDLQEEVTGTKCSLMHSQEWGVKERHNAIILELEPRLDPMSEVSVRILFCNPTHQSMKPCPYHLDGKCKFNSEDCRFSHGHVVKLSELSEFQEPDFSSMEVGSKCLARYQKDHLWYPAEVDAVDEELQKFTVKFESYGDTADLGLAEILPRVSHPMYSSSDDDDYDDDDEEKDSGDDQSVPSTSQGLPKRREAGIEEEVEAPTLLWRKTPGVALGQWEEHTRGIGSMLMAKMGYEYGKGLGKYSQGRVEIVEAVVLPPGRSLDKCMELKQENKCHIVGKEKKKVKGKGKHKAAAGPTPVKQKKDVFAFINNKLKGRKAKISDLLQENFDLVKTDKRLLGVKATSEPTSGRKINIQLMKTQEEITNTKRGIVRLKQSLERHERDKKTKLQIEFKIAEKQKYLASLTASEKKLERQQQSRNHHRKLTVF